MMLYNLKQLKIKFNILRKLLILKVNYIIIEIDKLYHNKFLIKKGFYEMGNLFDITKIKNGKTRLITAENVYGKKGKGGMAEVSDTPQDETKKIGQLWSKGMAARELGTKWKVRPCISLASESVTTIMDIDGPGCITHIWITVDSIVYRDLIIRMYWDNEIEPSVEVPLGDFFCCGFSQRQKVLSIPINVNPSGGMNSYFPMPFREHAKITIENRRPSNVDGFFYAITYELDKVADDEAYFHANFNRTNPLKYGDDYVIIDGIKGKGHFVGTQMCWQQNNAGWWGEGEIKAFIDGDDEFPTYVGTGTEDYFGGAWCFGENYSAPFLGYQDITAVNGRHTTQIGNRHVLYRFHILDPIRFDQDLKITMQAIGWRSEGRYLPLQDDISSVAYWYQTEPHAKFSPIGCRNDLEVI